MRLNQRHPNVPCPECHQDMEWHAEAEGDPNIEYHCDSCPWKGTYNPGTKKYKELSPEEYRDCNNMEIDELIELAEELDIRVDFIPNELPENL